MPGEIPGPALKITIKQKIKGTRPSPPPRGYLGTSMSKPLSRISGAHLDSIKTGPEFVSVVMLKKE